MNEMKLVEEFCAAVPPPAPERLGPARARMLAAAGARTGPRPAAPGAWRRSSRRSWRVAPGAWRRSSRRSWRVAPARLAWTGALAVATAAALVAGLGLPFSRPAAPASGAAQVLYRAATAALTQPIAGAGQYIYTEVTGSGGVNLPGGPPRTGQAVVQTWQSVDGTRAGAIKSQNTCGPLGYAQVGLLPGVTASPPPARPVKTTPVKARPVHPKRPPANCSAIILPTSWSPPASTYDGLKTLPTSPSALLAYLNAHYQQLVPPGWTMSSAAREYLAISDILGNLGVLPGALESAMFRALAELPGMTIVPGVTDYAGRSGTAVAWSHDGYRFELIFNPSTYKFMGQQEVAAPGNPEHVPAGQVVWGLALLASGVTSTVPAVSHSTAFYPILWQDFAPGLPNTN